MYRPMEIRGRLHTGGKTVEEIKARYTGQGLTYKGFESLQRAFDLFDEQEISLFKKESGGETVYYVSRWPKENMKIKTGNIRRHGGKLYKCVQDHTSQEDWSPDTAASLWACTSDPAEEWPAWSQPIGAHDSYSTGAKVSHQDKHWISDTDGNVWEPGVYGWTEAAEEE